MIIDVSIIEFIFQKGTGSRQSRRLYLSIILHVPVIRPSVSVTQGVCTCHSDCLYSKPFPSVGISVPRRAGNFPDRKVVGATIASTSAPSVLTNIASPPVAIGSSTALTPVSWSGSAVTTLAPASTPGAGGGMARERARLPGRGIRAHQPLRLEVVPERGGNVRLRRAQIALDLAHPLSARDHRHHARMPEGELERGVDERDAVRTADLGDSRDPLPDRFRGRFVVVEGARPGTAREDPGVVRATDDDADPAFLAEGEKAREGLLLEQGVAPGEKEDVEVAPFREGLADLPLVQPAPRWRSPLPARGARPWPGSRRP